jgi:hypothetical protein
VKEQQTEPLDPHFFREIQPPNAFANTVAYVLVAFALALNKPDIFHAFSLVSFDVRRRALSQYVETDVQSMMQQTE